MFVMEVEIHMEKLGKVIALIFLPNFNKLIKQIKKTWEIMHAHFHCTNLV